MKFCRREYQFCINPAGFGIAILEGCGNVEWLRDYNVASLLLC